MSIKCITMKKIIIPFDGGNFSKGAFSFACNVNKKTPILLTGIFLAEINYESLFFFPSAFAAPAYIPAKEGIDEAARTASPTHSR